MTAAEYFSGFEKGEVAQRLGIGAGRIYEFERRSRNPSLSSAIDLATRAVVLTEKSDLVQWAEHKYRLALLQQIAARTVGQISEQLFDAAIANAEEVLKHAGREMSEFDAASCTVVLGNAYLGRGQLGNTGWERDIATAVSHFEKIAAAEKTALHRSHVFNNISAAYRYLALRGEPSRKNEQLVKAKKALACAIEMTA